MSSNARFDFILDAWAVLAHFGDETGAERVREVLQSGEKDESRIGISVINVGEVAYITERERGITKVHEALAALRSLPITVLPADERVVLAAAHIKANHRLSDADAFAAATASLWDARLMTGDPELKALDGNEISVEWIGKE
jgi:predicted nucleic acid-binding protein